VDDPDGAHTERYLKKNVPPPARVAYELTGWQYRREVTRLASV
jgi:hypothetical protein